MYNVSFKSITGHNNVSVISTRYILFIVSIRDENQLVLSVCFFLKRSTEAADGTNVCTQFTQVDLWLHLKRVNSIGQNDKNIHLIRFKHRKTVSHGAYRLKFHRNVHD